MHIRPFQIEDYDAVTDLWKATGLHLNRSDSVEGIRRKLERDADLFLVAVEDGAIIGVVMGAYDGRRGWINHLAVSYSHQGQGVGRHLMQEVESRLRAKGCDKVNLLVEPANIGVPAFYERLGYQRRDLILMQKWIDEEDFRQH
jgi:ribosomal protein S18 acetylase RimI-like enzyme